MEKPKNQAKRRIARFVSQRIQFNGFNGLQCESCPINCVVWFRLIQMHRSKWDVPERFADKLWEELKFCWPHFFAICTKPAFMEWWHDLMVALLSPLLHLLLLLLQIGSSYSPLFEIHLLCHNIIINNICSTKYETWEMVSPNPSNYVNETARTSFKKSTAHQRTTWAICQSYFAAKWFIHSYKVCGECLCDYFFEVSQEQFLSELRLEKLPLILHNITHDDGSIWSHYFMLSVRRHTVLYAPRLIHCKMGFWETQIPLVTKWWY